LAPIDRKGENARVPGTPALPMKKLIYFVFIVNTFITYSQELNEGFRTYKVRFFDIKIPGNMYVIANDFITPGTECLNLGLPIGRLQEYFEKQDTVFYAVTRNLDCQIEIKLRKANEKDFMVLNDAEINFYMQNVIKKNNEDGIEYTMNSIYKTEDACYAVLDRSQMPMILTTAGKRVIIKKFVIRRYVCPVLVSSLCLSSLLL
jgi:hypothetical protein